MKEDIKNNDIVEEVEDEDEDKNDASFQKKNWGWSIFENFLTYGLPFFLALSIVNLKKFKK